MGRKYSDAHRLAISEGKKGDKTNLWKGGVSKENKLIRASTKYRLWREAVFKRDNYTCQICGERGVRIQADHIKPFALFPEERFSIENGRTLCIMCHTSTETFGGNLIPYMRSLASKK